MTKAVSIMGVTGSIGGSALSVIEHANAASREPIYTLDAIASGRDAQTLARVALKYKPKLAVIADDAAYSELKDALSGSGIEVAAGLEAVCEAASRPVHRVLAAIVGIVGLPSTFAAVRAGNSVALANKESMVCAGPLLKREAARSGSQIIPTDSEHNAMFQVLDRSEDVEKLILTASGGPFRETAKAHLADMRPADALNHPKWDMGQKISIDSATLFNKGLELIEASYLFDVPEDRIDVVIHPQSIVHSLISYRDGSVLAQLGTPDMRTPIAYALSWPDRRQPAPADRLNLVEIGRLDFEALDDERFPSVRLAREALKQGGAAPTALNCANERAVAAFLAGQCGFNDISRVVETVVDRFVSKRVLPKQLESVEEIMALEQEALQMAEACLAETVSVTERS